MKTLRAIVFAGLVFIGLFPILSISYPIEKFPPLLDEVGAGQSIPAEKTQSQETEKDLFQKRIDVEGNYWEAQALLQNYKVISLLMILLFTLVGIGLYRRFVKRHLPSNPLLAFLMSFAIFILVTISVNLLFYWLAVRYQLLGMDRLNEYVQSMKWWLQLRKSWSLGLGSFYTAHIIDLASCGLMSYFGIAFTFNWIMGVKE